MASHSIPNQLEIIEATSGKSQVKAHLKIFIGGIPLETTEEDLFEFFSKFGKISKIRIERNRFNRSLCFGHLETSDQAVYNSILAKSLIPFKDRLLDCRRHVKGKALKNETNLLKKKRLYVYHLDEGCTLAKLNGTFRPFGRIHNSYLLEKLSDQDGPEALVIYSDPDNADIVFEKATKGEIKINQTILSIKRKTKPGDLKLKQQLVNSVLKGEFESQTNLSQKVNFSQLDFSMKKDQALSPSDWLTYGSRSPALNHQQQIEDYRKFLSLCETGTNLNSKPQSQMRWIKIQSNHTESNLRFNHEKPRL